MSTNNDVTLGAVATSFDNKKCVADENGYYDVVLSVLRTTNRAGQYYTFNDNVKKLLTDSSIVLIKIGEKKLFGEYGHPKYLPGMSEAECVARFTSVYEERVAMHIKSVSFREISKVNPVTGERIVLVRGKIKPFGPFASILNEALTNPDMNPSFSIRAEFNGGTTNGIPSKTLVEIFTWDYVLIQGQELADQDGSSMTAESLDELSMEDISIGDLEALMDNMTEESDKESYATAIEKARICKGAKCVCEVW